MGRRIRWLGVVLLICFALVIVQLANIQFRRANALSNDPNNPAVSSKQYANKRGTITASDGTVLARSVKTTDKTDPFHYYRIYPQGPLYAGITGYDSRFYGTSGIEFEYNQYLGTHVQPAENFSQLLFNKPPSEPDDVTLTVDPVLQAAATNALKDAPLSNKDGAVVVIDPTTGAVLALASNPTYDPNPISAQDVTTDQQAHFEDSVKDREGFDGLQPLATEGSFAPGSTFKVITSTAVYNLKPSLTDFSFPVAGQILFPDSGGKALTNDGGDPCGGTMAIMLPQSCDPGYGALGVKLGVPTLTKQAEDFGYSIFQSKSQYIPNLDLPNVASSTFSALLPNAQALLADSAIGQFNDSSTPLEGALVAAGIANGGVIMTPHLMAQIRDAQGNIVKTYKPTPMLTAASPSAAAAVNKLMQAVNTAPGATARGLFPDSWHVAIKTGTAQAPVTSPSGVTTEETDDWMIGFMPAVGTPRIAVAVVEPQQSFTGTGAGEAGPLVKKVFQAYLDETGSQG
ncbi:MAG TPA: penicillin-binding transpeptidase domain-containing protein [Acidimicrobiales bacterium]|jgi:peptidoglycan glycosyltransferase|nr:penicillin-binding transpeptidase domain-containing protein [Acidimicrobiales bacterium]